MNLRKLKKPMARYRADVLKRLRRAKDRPFTAARDCIAREHKDEK